MSEQLPTPEEPVNKEQLVAILKGKGFDDPAAFDLLTKWNEQREAELKNAPALANLELNIERAEIYLEAGYPEHALLELHDLLDQATGEGDEHVHEYILGHIARIEENRTHEN